MHNSSVRIVIVALVLCAFSYTMRSTQQAAASSRPSHGKVNNNRLAGKTIVITGASSGFGRGAALSFAQQGANVVIASRRIDELELLARQCGPNTTAVKVDVTDAKDVELLAQTARQKFGRIDAWVNAAGIGAVGRFLDIPLKDHARVIQTDLNGVINGSYFALQQFKNQRQGVLINIASIVGEIPLAYYATYSAAKGGIASFDRAVRAELKAEKLSNIHVCTVYPMPTDTPFWTHAANYSQHTLQPPLLQKPEPVVKAIVRLVTKPRNEVHIGSAGKIRTAAHRLFPNTVENVAARIIRDSQTNSKVPEAANTDGALFEPMRDGTDVRGDVAARLKKEKQK